MSDGGDAARTSAPLRVVEISSGVAGAYAGWLLSRLGAAVTRTAEPDDAGPGPEDATSLARRFLDAGKARLPLPTESGADGSRSLDPLAAADIVICDDTAALKRLSGRSPDGLAVVIPHTVLGVASIFGLTGPLADAPATPLDAQAVSSVSWVLGEKGREPLSIPPGILECQSGAHLAAACLMAFFVGGPSDRGRLVDVSLADILASYVGVNCRFLIHHGLAWERAGRRASGSGGAYPFVILPCRDGDVCLSGRTRDEWTRFVKAMGDPAWAHEPRYQNLRAMGQQYPDEVDALVMPWLRQHTKAEIADLANRFQLTISPVRSFAEVLATPQFRERGFFGEMMLGAKTVQTPGLPFKIVEARAPGADDSASTLLAQARAGQAGDGHSAAPDKPLAGLRVLDLGWVWSAPQVAGILAQFGAEVIKVEHGQRLDNTRLAGRVIKNGAKVEGPSTEMSPMFHQINRGKLGITLNLKEPKAVALVKQLAQTSDIVLENMAPGAMERTGLGYEDLRPLNDRLIMLAMSGAGQFGPLADMRTYAPVMSSFVGLEALVGYLGETPVGALNFALGDPNAAVHALVALFGALIRRQATGRGCYIDLSQTEALLATLTPYFLLAQSDERQPAPMGNAHPTQAPHGIYPTLGQNRWMTIAVEDDRQWAGLAALAMAEPWAGSEPYETAAGRVAGRPELDRQIAAWTSGQEREALVRRLRAAGVAASPVQSIGELWTDAHFSARGMTQRVALPFLGEEDLFRPPWLFSGLQPEPAPCGPRLGEHNDFVFKTILGLSDPAYEELKADGVIA